MKLPKLPEILEISSGSRLGGCSWDDQAAGAARIRKEKHGLVIRITYTCEVGLGPDCSVFPYCHHFITPQTPKLPNQLNVARFVVLWSWMSRRARENLPTFIPKIVELAIDWNLDSWYYVIRNRRLAHL